MWTWCIGFVALLILALFCWFCAIKRPIVLIHIVAIVVTIAAVVCLIGAFHATPKTETLYKVTIDSNVSYKDFVQYYEVVEVEGEIYTIREISNNNNVPTMPTYIIEPTWDTSAVG